MNLCRRDERCESLISNRMKTAGLAEASYPPPPRGCGGQAAVAGVGDPGTIHGKRILKPDFAETEMKGGVDCLKRPGEMPKYYRREAA